MSEVRTFVSQALYSNELKKDFKAFKRQLKWCRDDTVRQLNQECSAVIVSRSYYHLPPELVIRPHVLRLHSDLYHNTMFYIVELRVIEA